MEKYFLAMKSRPGYEILVVVGGFLLKVNDRE
jgi:hypothetical protein